MQRRKLSQFLLPLLIIGSILSWNLILYIDFRINPSIKMPYVSWQSNPNTQVWICWETPAPEDAIVYFGLSPDVMDFTILNTSIVRMHRVLLNSLIPNSTYYYKAGAISPLSYNFSQIFQFKTAPLNKFEPFNFIAVSDTQQMGYGNIWLENLCKKIGQIDTSFLTIGGDLTQDGKEQINWDDFFGNIASITNHIPIIPVVGNHDSDLEESNGNAVLLRQYFPISVSANRFYYSFNYSMVHFSMLDVEWGNELEFNSEQSEWLEQDLTNAQTFPFRIVIMHCPIKDSAFFGNNLFVQNSIKPLLQHYNVSLVLSGHDHHYEHLEDDGMHYVTLGSGGSLQDIFQLTKTESKRISLGPSYTRIWANSSALHIKTYALNEEILDQFTIYG
jgi:hypothetical protein